MCRGCAAWNMLSRQSPRDTILRPKTSPLLMKNCLLVQYWTECLILLSNKKEWVKCTNPRESAALLQPWCMDAAKADVLHQSRSLERAYPNAGAVYFRDRERTWHSLHTFHRTIGFSCQWYTDRFSFFNSYKDTKTATKWIGIVCQFCSGIISVRRPCMGSILLSPLLVISQPG